MCPNKETQVKIEKNLQETGITSFTRERGGKSWGGGMREVCLNT